MTKRYKKFGNAKRYRKPREVTIWVEAEPAKPEGYENVKIF